MEKEPHEIDPTSEEDIANLIGDAQSEHRANRENRDLSQKMLDTGQGAIEDAADLYRMGRILGTKAVSGVAVVAIDAGLKLVKRDITPRD